LLNRDSLATAPQQRLAELEAVIAKLKAENEKAAEARAPNRKRTAATTKRR
jgi:hypothetical protein